ncbi:uncharacterized protein cubi_03007 [Cryptosporidium ubiquitum]|uniref:Uncharacterized protein n=1 Tax=Cryptosporidium ubiquitum TaxID=857276 RepID=A0A1J4MN42_9CRYT|nr:uncharacterized protein cubi_03007 [Cryptosporidium ubiquitum]OII74875.1 hypothetical protein cubi_03007 [Cryptosporidium ubiquitum]
MYTQNRFSPKSKNDKSKFCEKNKLDEVDDVSINGKIHHKSECSIENFWFDYRIWCILFKVNLEQISSINQFISNNILNAENDYVHIESIIYKLEKKNSNNKLIRFDFERFRPNIYQKNISYPKIPKGFYGIDNFLELIEKDFNYNISRREYNELLTVLTLDSFPSISSLKIIDKLVFVTITICEYLKCNYLQGMHEIVGCLAFLQKNPVPINYHIILSIEIINRWAKFLILPNLFKNYNTLLNGNKIHKLEKDKRDHAIIEAEDNENVIIGFLHDYFISDQFNETKESIYKDINENLQNSCLSDNSTNTNSEMKFSQCFENEIYEPIYQNPKIKINAIEQILNICNEFHSFGCFHIPNIFNEIEKCIESNIWCCNVFITCGSSLFIEIENVLLFWLNLIFSSSEVDYKPPFFPKIQSQLQLAAFLIVLLKSLEHQLRNDIYLICTDRFKLDLDLNLRIGIVSILNPFLIPNNNLENTDFSKTIQHSPFEEFIGEKKSLFLDLFQVILAMESLLMSTPISLQKRVINTLNNFDSTSSFEEAKLKNVFINFIEPKELLYYDKDFTIKNKKCSDGIVNIISGKDIVLIDILSSFYFDNAIDSDLDRLIRRLESAEEFIKFKEGNTEINYELSKLFDEELLSILLLPMLRFSLKTARIVKIPLEKDKKCINSQAIFQFLEFASRRQRALLIQQRPSIWIIYGPKNELRDEFAYKLIENGLIGVQLIDTNKVFNELLEKCYFPNKFDFFMNIIKDVKSNLCLANNRTNYKSRALLKISTIRKKNIIKEPLITINTTDYNQNRKVLNSESKLNHEKQEYLNVSNRIVKFKPNRRKMYYK